jgi:glycosyltransferase involved in cell wall biosynthesis
VNILHLISSSGYFGAEKVLVELAAAAKKTIPGASPFIGIIRNRYNPHSEICDAVKNTQVPCALFDCRSRFDLKTIRLLRAFIKENHIDVVHSHGYKSNFYAFAAALFTGVKKVSTVHNWIRTDAKLKVYEMIDKLLLRQFDKIAVVSEALVKELRASGIPDAGIKYIANGLAVEPVKEGGREKSRKSLGIADKARVVGTVGRISKEKGQIFLVNAAPAILEDFPEAVFLIIGDGELKDECAGRARALGLEKNFIFTGIRNDIPVLLAGMDVFVLPSLDEGMPMAVLEAMAAGKPVVATGTGSIPRIIDEGKNGLVVEPGNSAALSGAVKRLLKDPAAAAVMGSAALNRIKSEYSADKMAGEYMKLYAGALEKHNG